MSDIETPLELRHEIFKEVGRLCMVWAGLDEALDMLVATILGCTDEQAHCISAQVDRVSSRLTLIKTLAITLNRPDFWKDDLHDFANWVINELAPLRNRIVHDAWDFEDMAPVQVDKRVKIKRVQSREPFTLQMRTKTTVTPDTIADLSGEVSYASTVVLCARADLKNYQESEELRAEASLLRFAFRTARPQIQERRRSERESKKSSRE